MVPFYLFLGSSGAIAVIAQLVVWTVIVAIVGVPSHVRRKVGHRGLIRMANESSPSDSIVKAVAVRYARRMRWVNRMLLATVALALCACVSAFVALGGFDARDACLDRGGAWDFENGRCAP